MGRPHRSPQRRPSPPGPVSGRSGRSGSSGARRRLDGRELVGVDALHMRLERARAHVERSLAPVSRSIRWPPGSELTRSESSGTGRSSTHRSRPCPRPSTRDRSRGSSWSGGGRRPRSEQDVGEHGQVLLLETARLTTARPRARFSCITESFTSGHSKGGRVKAMTGARRGLGCVAQGSRVPRSRLRSLCVSSLFTKVRHHRHNGVEPVDGHAPARSIRRGPIRATSWTPPPDRWTDWASAVDDSARSSAGLVTSIRLSTPSCHLSDIAPHCDSAPERDGCTGSHLKPPDCGQRGTRGRGRGRPAGVSRRR